MQHRKSAGLQLAPLPASNTAVCACLPCPCRYVTDPDGCTTYWSRLHSTCTMSSPFYLEYDCITCSLPQQVCLRLLSPNNQANSAFAPPGSRPWGTQLRIIATTATTNQGGDLAHVLRRSILMLPSPKVASTRLRSTCEWHDTAEWQGCQQGLYTLPPAGLLVVARCSKPSALLDAHTFRPCTALPTRPTLESWVSLCAVTRPLPCG